MKNFMCIHSQTKLAKQYRGIQPKSREKGSMCGALDLVPILYTTRNWPEKRKRKKKRKKERKEGEGRKGENDQSFQSNLVNVQGCV